MSEKTREICTVVSQESIGAGIYSMWIQTDRIAADAKPGQFVSLYTNDKSKILPRPISLCEIDKENGRLHLVYRVTGQGTGTDEFSQMKAGDTIPVLGPLGNGFPVEKAEGKKVFLMGGGIGVPPILELAKQMKCEKKQIIAGYRDCHTFLREEFEAAGTLYMPADQLRCFVQSRNMPKKMGLNVIFPWRNVWHAESVPALPVCANPEKKMHIAM